MSLTYTTPPLLYANRFQLRADGNLQGPGFTTTSTLPASWLGTHAFSLPGPTSFAVSDHERRSTLPVVRLCFSHIHLILAKLGVGIKVVRLPGVITAFKSSLLERFTVGAQKALETITLAAAHVWIPCVSTTTAAHLKCLRGVCRSTGRRWNAMPTLTKDGTGYRRAHCLDTTSLILQTATDIFYVP